MPHRFDDLTPEQDEEQTQIFLRTNGPSPREFEPSIPAALLHGKTESEKWLLEKTDVGIKQNNWLVRQVVGLKAALRVQQRRTEQVKKDLALELAAGVTRFEGIEKKLEPVATLWNKWLTRKKVVRHITLTIIGLFLLPFLALFAVEWLKHWLGWK
jgi:hypothetical protein